MSRFTKWSLSLKFPYQNFVRTHLLSHALYMPTNLIILGPMFIP
jgi:hypothetical protein